jgi:hypothetical protein
MILITFSKRSKLKNFQGPSERYREQLIILIDLDPICYFLRPKTSTVIASVRRRFYETASYHKDSLAETHAPAENQPPFAVHVISVGFYLKTYILRRTSN